MSNIKYERVNFVDHIVEHPNRIELKDNTDGTKTIVSKQGVVFQQGTPHSANVMNRLDEGILNAHIDIEAVRKEQQRIKVQLELDGRVPNSNGTFFDVLDGSESRNIVLDKAKADVIEEILPGTLNIKVDTTEGFKEFTEVTIQDDINTEDILITTVDEVNKTITVNKLVNGYKKGAVIARSTISIYTVNQEMSTDVWGTYDINLVEVV